MHLIRNLRFVGYFLIFLDKAWHDGLIFKLRQNGISGDIINILQDFLRNRKQRVVLNGQCSSWADVNAGVPQGSILGPLLFFIYINDSSDGLKTECKLFTDDTSLFSVVNDINTSASILMRTGQIGNRAVLKHCKIPKYYDQDCRLW